jgi:predicted AlkP superfamily phosphohydrolase/phosphomutase
MGCIPSSEYEAQRDALVGELRDWRDPESGSAVVRRVWRREEIYAGRSIEHAPDLVLELEEEDGYSLCTMPSRGRPGPSLRRLPARELGGKRFSMSGSHRPDGMFILAGPRVAAGNEAAAIADMAPTILSLCGLAVPIEMEGRSLVPPNAGRERPAVGLDAAAEQFYSPGDEAILEERLRALGYLG